MEILSRWATGTVAVIVVALALLAVRLADPTIVNILKLKNFDLLLTSQPQTTSEEIVLLDIGEPTLKEWGQWPPKRDKFADLVKILREKQATVIVFNILFAEADRLGGDDVFAKALKDNGIVVSQTVSSKGQKPDAVRRGMSAIGEDHAPWTFGFKGGVAPIEKIANAADGVGVVVTIPEVDGVVRRMPMIVRLGDNTYPSLPLEVIRTATGDPSYQVKTTEAGIEAVRIPQFPIIKTDSNGRIWLGQNTKFDRVEAIDLKDSKVNLEGKIVIVGLTAEGLGNIIATPRGGIYAHDLQAQALQTVINGKTATRLAYADMIEIIAFAVFALLLIIIVPRTSVIWTVPLYATIIGSVVYGTYWLFQTQYELWDASFFILGGSVVFGQLVFNNFAREFRLKQQIKKQFGTYLSPAMVEKLQQNPDLLKLGGERRELSIMFTDVRGFTAISEHYGSDVEGLTKIMNRYMTAMTRRIIENNGTLDKYIGDAQMAFWNAPLDDPEHAVNAVRTALAMLGDLEAFNEEVSKEGVPPFGMGLGINTGTVVVGNMGSEQRFDYTCLGDAVNLASRLEGQSKPYGVKLVLGQETAKQVKGHYPVVKLDCIAVKGKTQGVDIYTVIEGKTYGADHSAHKLFLTHYRKQEWKHALASAENLKKGFGGELEHYYDMMIERINELKTQNLPKDWDGVYRATSK